MRDIKFRGKMIPENEWIYGTLLRIPHPPVCMGKEENDKYYIQFADPRYIPDWNMPYKMVQGEVKPETVGQYIGLKDKNGKEIYEGDIVKSYFIDEDKDGNEIYKYYIIKVKYDELMCCYNIDAFENLEVIGNIYENKELLEGK